MTELRRPELLDTARHNRGDFTCGDPTLDHWLRHYAGQNRRGNTAATWVITDEYDAVVAYATLSMTGVDLSTAPPSIARQSPQPVPALLLGRLAVDHRHAGLGVGTALVAHVLATALEINAKAACKAVVVVALHEQARSWWERLGFHPFDPYDPACLDLFLLTDEVERTLAELEDGPGR
ncbi:MAG: GNAT family N-acetyltransferase [Acidimicrobiales bacterium]